MADPWTVESPCLGGLERRLRRARELIDRLATESPDHEGHALAQLHIHAKLGVALQRLDRLEEAEESYRRAIALEGLLIDRLPRNGRPRLDRATTREALALLEIDRGRPDQARTILDAAAEDLRSLAKGGRMPSAPPESFDRLAAAYRKIGEAEKADAMARLAEVGGDRPPPASPRPPGRRRGPTRPGEGPL